MEPVGSIVSAMWTVVRAIVKAARTARRNKARCQELALRVKGVGDVLREYEKLARGDVAAVTTRRILSRLEGAIDDALKLVKCCGRSSSDGLLSRLQLHRLVASDGLGAKLDDVNSRITACLVDLHAANGTRIVNKINQLAADARNHRRSNSAREIHGGSNGNRGGWNKSGKRRRGKKAAGPPQPCPNAGIVLDPSPMVMMTTAARRQRHRKNRRGGEHRSRSGTKGTA